MNNESLIATACQAYRQCRRKGFQQDMIKSIFFRSNPMKTIHTILTTACCLAVISFTSVLKAGERLMTIEMADGNLVSFIMTPEEIATEDAAKANLELRRSLIAEKPRKRVVTYEMGEGGRMISFPMTENEIGAEDAVHARQEALRVSHIRKPEPEHEKIELAESGRYLTFPKTAKQRNNKDTIEIAKSIGK